MLKTSFNRVYSPFGLTVAFCHGGLLGWISPNGLLVKITLPGNVRRQSF